MDSSVQQFSPTEFAVVIKGQASDRRQPVHLIFVIDTSDSMNDSAKLASVKQSLQFVVPLLTPDDLVSIITFGDDSQIVMNKVPASQSEAILYAASSLSTNGCTNLSAGLMNVMDCVLPADGAPHKQGVLLLTDGHANRGVHSKDALDGIVRSLLEHTPSLTLNTVGYGHDHNTQLLRSAAIIGGGSYNVVYNLEGVATTFGEILGGMTTVVAQNVVVTLPATVEVKTGYATTKGSGGTVQVRIGDIYAENEIIILCSANQAPQVTLTYHNMITFSSTTTTTPTYHPYTSQPIPKNIEQARLRFQVSQLLSQSLVEQEQVLTDQRAQVQVQAQALWPIEAQALLTELKALSYADEQLIQMMVDDLETLLHNLQGRSNLAATTSMAQHSAYLSLGRGLRSINPDDCHSPSEPSQHSGHLNGDPIEHGLMRTATVDTTFSPFSNRAQRNATANLRQSSQGLD